MPDEDDECMTYFLSNLATEEVYFPPFFRCIISKFFLLVFTRRFGSSAGLFSLLFSFCFSSKVHWGGGFSRCSFLLLN